MGSVESAVFVEAAEQTTDQALVERYRNGDSAAFDAIVRRYKDRVFNAVYRYLGNREDALEVTQDTFIRAYERLEGFRGDAQLFTWLYRIATNLARNRLRDGHRKGRDLGQSLEALVEKSNMAAATPTPGSEAMAHETEAVLQQCLEELPEVYRMTFILRVIEDLDYDAIAAIMDCPRGTVKSRLNQARTLLRKRLVELSVL